MRGNKENGEVIAVKECRVSTASGAQREMECSNCHGSQLSLSDREQKENKEERESGRSV